MANTKNLKRRRILKRQIDELIFQVYEGAGILDHEKWRSYDKDSRYGFYLVRAAIERAMDLGVRYYLAQEKKNG